MTHKNSKHISSSKVHYLPLLLLVILLGLNPYLCLSNADTSEVTNVVQLPEGNPTIEFMFVPPLGSSYNLIGRVRNANPDSFKVAVYILVGAGWWTKPTFAEPLTSIGADSIWITDITTGGNDPYATKIHAFLLPLGVAPPLSAGFPSLPASLDSISVASIYTTRNPRSISFSGYDWWVKGSAVQIGPGPNYFSDSEENVWVDNQNQLHLKITNRNNKWYCAEVILNESLGYGKYIFKLSSKVGQINESAVLGLFTWDDHASNEFYREIDIEFSRWGVANDPNAQYVVQPYDYPGNLIKWLQPFELDSSTHIFDWQPDSISFVSLKGHQTSVPYDSIIHSWKYTGPNIPTYGNENARINLWLFRGQTPTDNSEIEVIISKFEYNKITSVIQSINTQPIHYYLSQNYPNPFNASTCIHYSTYKEGHVIVKVYNLQGKEVGILVNKQELPGEYEIKWHPKNLPSGIYFYQLKIDEILETKKMILLR